MDRLRKFASDVQSLGICKDTPDAAEYLLEIEYNGMLRLCGCGSPKAVNDTLFAGLVKAVEDFGALQFVSEIRIERAQGASGELIDGDDLAYRLQKFQELEKLSVPAGTRLDMIKIAIRQLPHFDRENGLTVN